MTFDLQPTLTGLLTQLRPLRDTDFENLYAAASDPLIWEQHPEPTRYQRDVFRKFFESGLASQGAFAILDQATQQIIGSSRYYNFKPEDDFVYIGYTFLQRACWGRGYNREVKTLMLTHAFSFVSTVFFEVGPHNQRSRLALAKIGAEYVKDVVETSAGRASETHCLYRLTAKS